MMIAISSELKSKSSEVRVTQKGLTASRFERCCKCYSHNIFKDYSESSHLHNLKTHEISKT